MKNHRNGQQISGWWGLRRRWRGGNLVLSIYIREIWEPVIMDIFCILTLPMPTLHLCYCTIVLQDVTIGGNWGKCTENHFLLLLTTACEFTIL